MEKSTSGEVVSGKAAAGGGNEPQILKLKVIGCRGTQEIHYEIKATSKLWKLMEDYNKRTSIGLQGVRRVFLFKNETIKSYETAGELGMVSGDVIQAF